jgi:hypothetical protein
MLFGHGVAGGTKVSRLFIGIKSKLAVVVGVAIRPHGEHTESLKLNSRISTSGARFATALRICSPFFEQFDRLVVVHRVGELGF